MKQSFKIPIKLRKTPSLAVSKNAMIRLNLCLLFIILWHIPNIPVWAICGASILCVWRLLIDLKKKSLPPKKTKFILTAIAIVAIILNFNSFLGRDPGITALLLLSSLKMLELKSHRDFMLIIYLCFFLLLGNFLYDQSITSFMFMIFITLLLTAAILNLNRQGEKHPGKRYFIKTSAWLLLQAIPLTIILFLFFPRAPGLFWNLRQRASTIGQTGFRDRIVHGEVAQIARSEGTAFRVGFPDNNMPAYKDLYFRGLVLWYTDGKIWFQGSFRPYRIKKQQSRKETIRQEILLEPHNRHWLFGLDTPYSIPRWSRKFPGHIFTTHLPLKRHIRYEVESILKYQPDKPISPLVKKWTLQLPRHKNAKISDLVDRWRETYRSDQKVVETALNYFKENNFRYTLAPDSLDPNDPVEDFLFKKRKGFCEHFASSFTIMMRYAGIPARVIVGYQGGKFNSVGKYLTVRQMDAHAWSEVWIDGQGWTRIDPTSVVAPERVEYGIEISSSLFLMNGDQEENKLEALRRALSKNVFKQIINTFDDLWDTIKINWSLWIISYDRYQQWSFLKNLGFIRRSSFILILFVVLTISLFLFLIKTLLKRETERGEPIIKYYKQFCKKLEKKGVLRFPWEGPLDFKQRASSAFPKQAKKIASISDLYIHLQYEKGYVKKNQLHLLKRNIREFKLE